MDKKEEGEKKKKEKEKKAEEEGGGMTRVCVGGIDDTEGGDILSTTR